MSRDIFVEGVSVIFVYCWGRRTGEVLLVVVARGDEPAYCFFVFFVNYIVSHLL